MGVLRLLLWDQLSASISCLKDCDKARDIIFIPELDEMATYVAHHQKKLVFLFSAMRHFAQTLKNEGFVVDYLALDSSQNSGDLSSEIQKALNRHQLTHVIVTEPSELWLQDKLFELQKAGYQVSMYQDTRFLCSRQQFSKWASSRKQLRMEYFYRHMRVEHDILMDGANPVGGKWNFDSDNRKPPEKNMRFPAHFTMEMDEITISVSKLVEKRYGHHFGDIHPFYLAVTRDGAKQALALFIEERLPYFGDYQDAMIEGQAWMYHSHLSFYINCGLLDAMECILAAQEAYYNHKAPINAVEGFIRQILGWREYVNGIYWLYMPDYQKKNHLGATRSLPEFFWSGKTKMNCLKQCVHETKQHAYAHHIQRLMVLGNFALIAGLHPDEVNEWYHIVYADAYQWVELPNVSGMVLYADGGLLASKPYAAGGSYIKKMSNYCQNCAYKVAEKTGEKACPFNYLYWDFLARNRQNLQSNPRIGMMYRTYDRMNDEKKIAIKRDSERFLEELK